LLHGFLLMAAKQLRSLVVDLLAALLYPPRRIGVLKPATLSPSSPALPAGGLEFLSRPGLTVRATTAQCLHLPAQRTQRY